VPCQLQRLVVQRFVLSCPMSYAFAFNAVGLYALVLIAVASSAFVPIPLCLALNCR